MNKMISELLELLEPKEQSLLKPGYVALNIAMSVWHMKDWLWADMDDAQKAWLAEYFGQEIRSKNDFTTIILQACPEIRICQVIATAGKHARVDKWADETIKTSTVIIEAPTEDDPHNIEISWQIAQGGVTRPAEEVLLFACRFWKRLLQELGLLEGDFITSDSPPI